MSEFRATVSPPLRRVSPMLFAMWLIVLCVLIAVPVALTLARETRYVASINATPRDKRVSPSELLASVRRLLRDPIVLNGTLQDARVIMNEADFAGRVTATSSARGLLVRVWGATPQEAGRLADALGPRLAQAAERNEEPRIIVGSTSHSGPTGFVDRSVDALPGAFPRRPDPIGVAFVGVLVALLVSAAFTLSFGSN